MFDLLLGVSMQFDGGESFYDDERMRDPLGIIRIEYETERDTTVFCEHISSIPSTSDRQQINHCGAMWKL